jgi:hypothetical protein
MFRGTLIRSGNNAKTVKGDGVYETAIMYLAPFTMAGANVCPMAEQAGCVTGCLNTAGRGAFSNVQLARVAKTKRYLTDRQAFMAELAADLAAFVRYCGRKGVKPAVRLNGTSDIQWEVAHPANGFKSIFEAFPQVRFYDYTKVYKRAYRELPDNYELTLSYSAANPAYEAAVIKAVAETGVNVAVVFRTKELRDSFMGKVMGEFWTMPVIDGDRDDLRFMDPANVVVGLYAKGAAKRDVTGFVVG